MKKILCSFLLIQFLTFANTTFAKTKLCSKYLDQIGVQLNSQSINPTEDYELLPFSIDLSRFPLDTVFLGRTSANPIKPFLWLIKNPQGQAVGALFGTSHKYVSLDMFDFKILDILSKADKVFLEHSGYQGGELFNKLKRLNSAGLKTFLSPESLKKLSKDETEFLSLRHSAENISGAFFYPLTQFIPYFRSPYGLKEALFEFSEVASSELATQPVSLDSQIERYAQSAGAKLSYLEVANEYAVQFTSADTEESIEAMILEPGNIFIKNYILLRKFLTDYRNRDLKALEDDVQQMSAKERDLTLILRNRRWIPKIVESLKVNKFTLVTTGVFHHFGPENIMELLSQFGYQFELVEL